MQQGHKAREEAKTISSMLMTRAESAIESEGDDLMETSMRRAGGGSRWRKAREGAADGEARTNDDVFLISHK
jgi:hypothetical protein